MAKLLPSPPNSPKSNTCVVVAWMTSHMTRHLNFIVFSIVIKFVPGIDLTNGPSLDHMGCLLTFPCKILKSQIFF
jgi:hypothetical protein